MTRPLREIYIDESFDVRSLRDLERQVLAAAREAWRAEVARERWRRLHPSVPGTPLFYDLNDPEIVQKWEQGLFAEVATPKTR